MSMFGAPPKKCCWTVHQESLLVFEYEPADGQPARPSGGPVRIAAFDLDQTLITTNGSHVFPRDADDWRFVWIAMRKHAHALVAAGYRVAVFSNQAGLGRHLATEQNAGGKAAPAKRTRRPRQTPLQAFRTKVGNVARALNVPLTVLAATSRDVYRKPDAGMWRFYLRHIVSPGLVADEMGEVVSVDFEHSFFVGDAAGRSHAADPELTDHSDADYLFARNCDLAFYTPEMFRDHVEQLVSVPSVEPMLLLKAECYNPSDSLSTAVLVPKHTRALTNGEKVVDGNGNSE